MRIRTFELELYLFFCLTVNIIDYEYNPDLRLLKTTLTSKSGQSEVQATNEYTDYGLLVETDTTSKGLMVFTHNAFGETVTQKSGKNVTDYLDYDDSARLIRRYNSTDGTSCWNYNSSNGRLDNEKVFHSSNISTGSCASGNGENHRISYYYDQNGRPDVVDVRIQGINSNINGTYTTTTDWDAQGRVSEVIYPNGLAISKTYQNGYLKKILNSDTGRVYSNVIEMNARGQVTEIDYANNTAEIYNYYEDTGRLDIQDLEYNGNNRHVLRYDYDSSGNTTYRRHEFNNRGYTDWNETLTYDSLNRLDYRNVSVTDSSYLTTEFKTDQNYNYDDWGNLTYRYGVGNYHYLTDNRSRLDRTTGTKVFDLGYDGSGNITSDGTRTFTYFNMDKVKKIVSGGDYTEFRYSANLGRYYKRDNRTLNSADLNYYTAYVGGYEKIKRVGGGLSTLTEEKVTVGNIVITERSNGTDDEHYLHKDNIGNAVSITNKSGSVVQQFTYDPWGKQTRIYQSSVFSNKTYGQPTNNAFTGHELIDGLDVVHMNGRIYDADLGRFLQADPFVQSPTSFQSFNRYAYVTNNPLSMTDPSGYLFSDLRRKAHKLHSKAWSASPSYYLYKKSTNCFIYAPFS